MSTFISFGDTIISLNRLQSVKAFKEELEPKKIGIRFEYEDGKSFVVYTVSISEQMRFMAEVETELHAKSISLANQDAVLSTCEKEYVVIKYKYNNTEFDALADAEKSTYDWIKQKTVDAVTYLVWGLLYFTAR